MKKCFLSLVAFMICVGAYATYNVSELTIQLTKDEAGITVTPSNNDPWDWYIVADTTFQRLGADSIVAVVYRQYGNQFASTGEQKFAFDGEDIYYYCSKGGTFQFLVWGSGADSITTQVYALQFEVGAVPYPNDAMEPFEVEYADYDIDTTYVAEYNVLYVNAKDADKRYINIEFNVATGTTAPAAGVYPVDNTDAIGTVTTGFVNGGRIAGSFANQLTETGIRALWVFGQGTVTVAEDGTITVDALNTKGTAINVVLHKQKSAIDVTSQEPKAKSPKLIENGLLIIRNNGKDYNAQGALIR